MLENSVLNTSKRKIFDNKPGNTSHLGRNSSSFSQQNRNSFRESPPKNSMKNKENDDLSSSKSSIYDLKDFSLPPTYKQDRLQLKELEKRDKYPPKPSDFLPKNPKYEAHPLDQQSFEESFNLRSKELDLLRKKNQDLERENLHLKKELHLTQEKLKFGFDQEKEILDRLAKIPKEQCFVKVRELMKEIHYWQERSAQNEQRLEEFSGLPSKLEELAGRYDAAIGEKNDFKRKLDEAREKIAVISQQKARVEGEIAGKGQQISKLHELEAEKDNLKRENEELKRKYEEEKARHADKAVLEKDLAKTKNLLKDRESRLLMTAEEIARLNQTITEKDAELNKMKGRTFRLDELQLMYQKEREIMNNEIKNLKKRLGEDGSSKNIHTMKKDYEKKINALEQEIAKTIEDKKAKVMENENLKKEISDLQVELRLKEDLSLELEEKERAINTVVEDRGRLIEKMGSTITALEQSQLKLNEYESKIIMLTTEIQRLNQLLHSKSEENDTMKLRFGEMDTRLLSQKEKYEEKLNQLHKELDNLKSKLRAIEATKALEINSLKIKLDDFKKLEKPAETNEEAKLNTTTINIGKKTEKEPVDNMKRRMKKEMMMLDERNRILKEDNEHIRRQAGNWRDELQRLEEENNLLRRKLKEQKNGLTDVQQNDALQKNALLQHIANESNQMIMNIEAKNRELQDKLMRSQQEIEVLQQHSNLIQQQYIPEVSPHAVELDQLRLENNELLARISLLNENQELLQRKYNDLERLYQNQKNISSQHFIEIDNLQKVHSEHRLAHTTVEREKQSLERAYEELKYKYASLELESGRNLQRIESEWRAKFQRMESELLAKYNKSEAEWNANFANSEARWKLEYDRVVIELRAKEHVDATFEARGKEYEEKVALLAGECEKLSQIIQDKEEEIQELKAQNQQVELLDKQELHASIEKLKHMLELKLNELDSVTLHRDQLQRIIDDQQIFSLEYERNREILLLKDQELEGLAQRAEAGDLALQGKAIVEGELAKVSHILHEKVLENEEWRDKYQRLESLLYEKGGLEQRCMDFEEKERRLHKEMDRLSAESRQKSQDNEVLLKKIRNLELAMNDSINLQQEILRLKNILEEKLEEIDEWKSKCSRFEAVLNEKGSLEGKVLEYERKIDVLSRDMEKLGYVYREKSRESEDLRVVLAKQDSQISDRAVLEAEIRRLKEILEEKLHEMDNMQTKISGLELALQEKDAAGQRGRETAEKTKALSSEIEKMSGLLKGKNDEIEDWRVKWAQALVNDGPNDRKTAELVRELEKIGAVFKEKANEIEEWRNKYAKLEGSMRDREALEREVLKMKEILQSKVRESDDWKSKYAKLEVFLSETLGFEEKMQDYEGKIAGLAREIERLGGVLQEKISQLDEARAYISRLEVMNRDNEVLEKELRNMKDILGGKLVENDDLRATVSKLQLVLNEKAGSDDRLREYEDKISLLANELERISRFLREKTEENEEFRTLLAKLEGGSRNKEYLSGELMRIKGILNQKLTELDEQRQQIAIIPVLTQEKAALEQEISALHLEISRFSQQLLPEKALQIEALKQKIQSFENRGNEKDLLSADIEKLRAILQQKNKEIEGLQTILANYEREKRVEIENLTRVLESKRLAHVETNVKANNSQKEEIVEKLKQALLETEQWKFQCVQAQAAAELENSRSQQALIQLQSVENNYKAMEEENQRLRESLDACLNEKDQAFKELDHCLAEKETVKDSLEREIQGLAQKISELDEALAQKINENANFLKNLQDCSLQNADFKGKIEVLLGNVEKLSQELGLKVDENEDLKRKLRDLPQTSEPLSLEIQRLKQENATLKQEIQRCLQEQERLRQDLENSILVEDNFKDLENKLSVLQGDLHNKTQEIERWKRRYEALEGEVKEIKGKSEFSSENQRLELLLGERSEELQKILRINEELSAENQRLKQENLSLLRENEQIREKIAGNSRVEGFVLRDSGTLGERDEKSRLKKLLGDKIVELDQVKSEYTEKLKEKTQEIEKLKQGMFELGALYKKDMAAMERKVKENNKITENTNKIGRNSMTENEEIGKLKQTIQTLHGEIGGLKNELLEKNVEIENLRDKNMNLEHINFLNSLKKRDSVENICFSERKNEQKPMELTYENDEDKVFVKPFNQ